MGRKALMSEVVRLKLDELIKRRERNGIKGRLTAKIALGELRIQLPRDTQLPGESRIRRELADLKKPREGPLDKPWSIGACIEHKFPSDSIQLLTDLRTAYGDYITIRLARWFVLLFPFILPL